MAIDPNTRLGRYEIRSQIGAGGMGDVYAAVDTLLGRQVAIKVFPPEFGREAERLARFVREAKAASALNHPGILTVFDVGKKSGMYFIVTELVEGITIREWVKRDRPSLADLAGAIRQAARALDAAHRAGIVHRDIKPENLMRRDDGLIKVLDFGIAKIVGTEGTDAPEQHIPLTAEGTLVGTVRYMSPEQASSEPVDGRTDIWSLGVVLYELASGRPPFGKGNAISIVVDITTGQPPPLSTLLPGAPSELHRVVDRAMRRDPCERFQTAAEMAEALDKAIDALRRESSSGAEPSDYPDRDAVTEIIVQPNGHTRVIGSAGGPTSGESNTRSQASKTYVGRRRFKLIGRKRELSDITSALRLPEERLLTITGPGGIGKTRLAAEAGYELQLATVFPDGVFFVDLSTLSEPEMIAGAIARVLGVVQPHGNILDNALRREIANKRILLVLDNFEHLLEGATLVSELLKESPELKMLVTSRAPLRLSEEREYQLEPLEVPATLTLPPLEELALVPAVALFVERARHAKPAFALTDENARAVVEVCRKLEGLPLALELAAARIKLLTPRAMLERLDHSLRLLTGGPRDLPGRQQTIRGAVSWSYDLLDDQERSMLRQLSVFVDGCTLAAAEAVCSSRAEDVVDTIGSLIDNSLVKQREQNDGELRFAMLEVVREYANEMLEASGEATDVSLDFARYFKQMAEEADIDIRTGNQVAAVRRLSREHENVKSALTVLLETHPAEGAAFVGSVQSYWSAQGYSSSERRGWLIKALSAGELPPTLRARLLNGLTRCEVRLGRPEDAIKSGREAVDAARASGDLDVLGMALGGFGHALSVAGELAPALEVFRESADIAHRRGSPHSLSVALGSIGEVLRISGDLEAATIHYEQALEAAGHAPSNPTGIILANLGGVSLEKGNFAAARRYYREALKIVVELGNMLWASTALNGLAAVELSRGNGEKAALLFGAAEAVCEAGGSPLEAWEQSLRDRYVAQLRSSLDPETLARQWSHGRSLSLKEAATEAMRD